MSKYPRSLREKQKTESYSTEIIRQFKFNRLRHEQEILVQRVMAEWIAADKRDVGRKARASARRDAAPALKQARAEKHADLLRQHAEYFENQKKRYATTVEVLNARLCQAVADNDVKAQREMAKMFDQIEEKVEKYLTQEEFESALDKGEARFQEAKEKKDAEAKVPADQVQSPA